MEENNKVFYSHIVRNENHHKNHLYDLLNITPAKPLKLTVGKKYVCGFIPKTDKIYLPKRRPGVKVNTVRDIRTLFENDTYTYLASDLELQQKNLLKKIRDGSSKNENTIKFAKKILESVTPISRSTWQMLINLNVDKHPHPRQFVLWNGKYIEVNGSTGGKDKLICDYDLGNEILSKRIKTKNIPTKVLNKKKGLLQNSLTVKFKPGPLRRKKYLDDSHQKHNGNVELIDLPKVELVVEPSYGTILEPTITYFLGNLCKDGTISEKWAEFAVSVLGKKDNRNIKLIENEGITFQLNYKCDQHKILMRKDLDNSCSTQKEITSSMVNRNATTDILPEIKDMMNKMLDAVEVNINQDNMFAVDEDLSQFTVKECNIIDTTAISREKPKRKYCELDRLDVTVIQLPESSERASTQTCGNAHCALGCVCDSLKRTYRFKQHCGREECMFDCKCDFSKYTNISSLNVDGSDLIPGIINIEDEINMRLAKEEQKFHQTVIVTGEKNILLKSERRNWKSSKKYEHFYKHMCLKHVDQKKRILSIPALKLNCENIEPWCMVHNLYKCFCKGKFTDTCSSLLLQNVAKDTIPKHASSETGCSLDKVQKVPDVNSQIEQNSRLQVRQETVRMDVNNKNKTMRMNGFAEKSDIYLDNQSNKTPCSGISTKSCENKRIPRMVIDISNDRHDTNMINTVSEDTEIHSDRRNKHKYSDSNDFLNLYYSDCNTTCSRVNGYEGRKYSDRHYKNTNHKIKEMEKNDKKLHKKMMSILNIDSEKESTLQEPDPESLHEANSVDYVYDINASTSSDGDESKRKHMPCENKLAVWFESNYKLCKGRIEQGLIKTSLEAPKSGKIVWHTWDFVLSRYRERKNLFLVSKQTPYRIFLAVNTNHKFFDACININEIRFADLYKYPQVVINLLTNATDLKDNFCIFRGLKLCWEIVCSVAKVNEINENTDETNDEYSDIESNFQSNLSATLDDSIAVQSMDSSPLMYTLSNHSETLDESVTILLAESSLVDPQSKHSKTLHESVAVQPTDSSTLIYTQLNYSEISDESVGVQSTESSTLVDPQLKHNKTLRGSVAVQSTASEPLMDTDIIITENETAFHGPEKAEVSKWFFMTVENDFSELRFYRRGFFIKYESIIKAISVARMSGKTVRLSSQKTMHKPNTPHFGVYAIPYANEYCVFIGPYEVEDSLGIETTKTISDVRKLNRSRGFWITTNKLDNMRVIDSPMSFVSRNNSNNKEGPLETHFCNDKKLSNRETPEEPKLTGSTDIQKENTNSLLKPGVKKTVKPITIRKTNGFYHLANDGLLKKISLQSPRKVLVGAPIINANPTVSLDVVNKISTSTSTPSNIIVNIEDLENLTPTNPTNLYPTSPKVNEGIQIKISNVYSQKEKQSLNNDKIEKGMFVLKPEEINRKLFEGQLNLKVTSQEETMLKVGGGETPIEKIMDTDSGGFAKDEQPVLNEDICVISDDENEEDGDHLRDVFLHCEDVPDLGWIRGRQKSISLSLSYKVPGEQYSPFYPVQDAFKQLNQQLTKITKPANPFNFTWRIVGSLYQVQRPCLQEDVQEVVNPIDCERLLQVLTWRRRQSPPPAVDSLNVSSNLKTYSKVKKLGPTSAALDNGQTVLPPILQIDNETVNLEDANCEETNTN